MKTSKMMQVAAATLVSCLAWCSAQAAATLPAEPVVGGWCSSFTKAKAAADAEGRPLVLLASSTGCSLCNNFNVNVFLNAQFQKWVSEQPYYFCKVQAQLGNWSSGEQFAIMSFVGGGTLPRFAVYWNRANYDGGEMIGGHKELTIQGGPSDYNYYINFVTKYVGSYTAETYKGGSFVTGVDAADCLQAEPTTAFVDVPLVREATDAYEQVLQMTAPGFATVTLPVRWAQGVTRQSVRIANFPTYHKVGREITLNLIDEDAAIKSTAKILCVSEQGNGPANPYWMGERTAETLEWGEWSMDLEVVKGKVSAYKSANPGQDAYVVLLVGGSLWCPDCANTDANLLTQQAFKDWAVRNHVVFGVVDVAPNPADAASTPSLLQYAAGDSWTPGPAKKSGAGYLSRKGAQEGDITTVIARNKILAGNDARNGGLNTPDRADGGDSRPGVPTLILLRDDGSIAGRLAEFSVTGKSPTSFSANYITRMDELLAQTALANEEKNDDRRTTTDEVALRQQIDGSTLSFTDRRDVYRVPNGSRMAFHAFNANAANSAEAILTLVQVAANGRETKLATSGAKRLKTGVAVTYQMPPAGTCYLMVEAAGAHFDADKADSSVCAYTLQTDEVLTPTETLQTKTLGDGLKYVTIAVSGGMSYRLSGVDKALAPVYTDQLSNSSGDTFVSQTAEQNVAVTLPLTGSTFSYQVWQTGRIGFTMTAASVDEKAGSYLLRITRTGGTAGQGGVTLDIDWERSSAWAGTVCEFDPVSHDWAEGDASAWEVPVKILDNTLADGAQTVVFRLTGKAGGDIPVGTGLFSLTVIDNDRPSPGKLQISGSEPASSGTSPVLAKEGTQVRIDLGRVQGSDGSVGCTLKTTDGNLDRTEFTWGPRDAAVKSAYLTVPAYTKRNQRVTVTLVPNRGVTAVSNAKVLTVQVVAAQAPEFVQDTASYSLVKFVDIRNKTDATDADYPSIGIRNITGRGKVKITRSGSMPGGVTFSYDETRQALVFKGAPTTAPMKPMTAQFRVSEGTVDGSSVTVTFNVIDATKASPTGGDPLNPSVAKSRTLSNLLVVNTTQNRLMGTLQVTIPQNGRVSARYTGAAGAVSLSSKGWQRINDDGAMYARFTGTTAKTADYYGIVTASANGAVNVSFYDPAFPWSDQTWVSEPPTVWNAKNPATAFKGSYTVSLPQEDAEQKAAALAKGDGYLTLKMTAPNTGRMTYAGMLPNGKVLSGSAVLFGVSNDGSGVYDEAWLPVFMQSRTDVASGVLRISADAQKWHKTDRRSVYPFTDFVWTCEEGAAAGLSYESRLGVYGGYYDSNEDFENCCSQTFETTELTFFSLTDGLVHPVDGTAAIWDPADTGVTVGKKNAIALKNRKNAQSLTFSFSKATGVVTGAFNQHFESGASVKATYKGVVLPGWGSAGCDICSGGIERPFISGASYFNVQRGYADEKGRARTLTVKCGCPFSVGTEPGK